MYHISRAVQVTSLKATNNCLYILHSVFKPFAHQTFRVYDKMYENCSFSLDQNFLKKSPLEIANVNGKRVAVTHHCC